MDEMEETVEAAATVIKYIGSSIVKDKCGELAAKTRGVEEAADAAGVDRARLSRAARELEAAAEEGIKLKAVGNLRDVSAALVGSLEGAAREQLHALRGDAANLARSCGAYREAAIGMAAMLRAKEGADGRRDRGSWWWCRVWRRCRRQQGLRENLLAHDVEAGVRPEEAVDRVDVAVAVDLLSQGTPQLRQRGAEIAAQARRVAAAANGARVPCDQLLFATDAFDKAGDPAALLDCIRDLISAATAVEAAESAPLKVVRDRAVHLERECLEMKDAADAMERVQRAAAKLRERRLASWWSRLWGRPRRRGEEREEELLDGAVAAAAAAAVQPGLGEGGERRSGWTSFVLGGSLGLITYLGPATVAERVNNLPDIFRWCFHAGLCVWWILQTAGMTCNAYAESLREQRCVQILEHLGMLALNGFVIVFAYLALGLHCKLILSVWLIFASAIHFYSFIVARRRGKLNH